MTPTRFPIVLLRPARTPLHGSPNRTRTCDNSINSRVLYQLSYQGIICICKANAIHLTTSTCRACFLCMMKEFAWRLPTLPGPCGPSTIGARGLNGRVRDGYVWNPSAIATKRAFVVQMHSPSHSPCGGTVQQLFRVLFSEN